MPIWKLTYRIHHGNHQAMRKPCINESTANNWNPPELLLHDAA